MRRLISILFALALLAAAGFGLRMALVETDGDAFVQAQALNTVESYQAFIALWPDSPLIGEAQGRILAAFYAEARQAGGIRALEGFIATHPQAPQATAADFFAGPARRRRATLTAAIPTS